VPEKGACRVFKVVNHEALSRNGINYPSSWVKATAYLCFFLVDFLAVFNSFT
jgi:hypothetical protein